LADVNRKNLPMRLAKLCFRLRHLREGGLLRPNRLDWEQTGFDGKIGQYKFHRPPLGMPR